MIMFFSMIERKFSKGVLVVQNSLDRRQVLLPASSLFKKRTIFSCRTESAAALEKTKKGEGDVRDISNLFQNYSGNDILRISGGYQGHFWSTLN